MKKSLLFLIGLLIISGCAKNSSSIIVEEFVGRSVQDVYAWCATLDDDHSCEVNYEDNGDYEKDIVFEQSIKAGKKFKDAEISFKVSNGYDSEIVLPYITPEVTVSDIEVWKEATGLITLNYVYETSDTVEKNHIIRMEPAAHVKKDTPVTVYVSSGQATPVSTDIEVKFGDYIGLTVEQFEEKAKALGLKPNHQTSRDKYDANIKFGNIVWHGSGVYVKDETFNYGVCINAITVNPGDYIGKTESEFIKIAKGLSLNPVHITGRDSYSSKIDNGNIVTHGSGVYVEGEEFKYGLSIGPAIVRQGYEGGRESAFNEYLENLTLKGDRKTTYSDTVTAGRIVSYNYGKYSTGDYVTYYVSLGPEEKYIDVPDFTGLEESTLLSFFSANGILVNKRTEESSLLPKGKVTSNDHGRMKAGDKASYTVSSGPAVQETAIIEAFNTVRDSVSHEGDYEHAEYDMKRYLFGRGFMDYDVVPVVYGDMEPGVLLSISIDGTELGDYPVNASLTSYIYCRISASIEE
ncbi:MAG: hypothetical protein IK151_07585 [Erysipelotrichaceae bacterium]|nr:hypothetical protein [Erysipelotrichaceae bacterium]